MHVKVPTKQTIYFCKTLQWHYLIIILYTCEIFAIFYLKTNFNQLTLPQIIHIQNVKKVKVLNNDRVFDWKNIFCIVGGLE